MTAAKGLKEYTKLGLRDDFGALGCGDGFIGIELVDDCRAAGRTDCVFPFDITYTEQKSGAALFIMVGTS